MSSNNNINNAILNIVAGLLRVATEEPNIAELHAMIDRAAGGQSHAQGQSSNLVQQPSTTDETSRMHQLADAAAILAGINVSPIHSVIHAPEGSETSDQPKPAEDHVSQGQHCISLDPNQTTTTMNDDSNVNTHQDSSPNLDSSGLDESFLTAFDNDEDIPNDIDGPPFVYGDEHYEAIAQIAEDDRRKLFEDDDSMEWFDAGTDHEVLSSDHNLQELSNEPQVANTGTSESDNNEQNSSSVVPNLIPVADVHFPNKDRTYYCQGIDHNIQWTTCRANQYSIQNGHVLVKSCQGEFYCPVLGCETVRYGRQPLQPKLHAVPRPPKKNYCVPSKRTTKSNRRSN